MPDPIEAAAKQAGQTPAQEQQTQQTPPVQTKEEAAGKAVSAAARFFSKVNNLEGQEKKEEKPKEEKKEEAPKAESKQAETKEPPKVEEPVNPVFGKKKSKKQQTEDLAAAVAKGNEALVEAVKQQAAPKPVEEVKQEEPKFSAKEQRLVEQLKKLEEINPNYKDVSSKYVDFKRKESEYEKKWQEAHPDEDFDPDAEEHAKFYERNEPEIDEDDLEVAKEAMIEERVTKKAQEKAAKELEPIKAQKQHEAVMAELKPKLEKTFMDVARDTAAQINPEFAKLTDLTKVAEADPLAAEILGGVANHWLPVIQVAAQAYNGAEFNPESPEGQRLGAVVTEIETGLLSLPQDERIRDGKNFATLAEFSKMDKAKRSRHWIVDEKSITDYASYRMKLDAKNFYDQETARIEKLAASRGFVRNSGQKPAPTVTEKQQEKPANSGFQPAPAVGSGPSAPPPSALRPDPDKNPRTKLGRSLGWA